MIVGEGHRRDAQASALTEEADGVVVGRLQAVFELADRGVDLPRDLGGVNSPPRLLHTVHQE